MKILSTIGRHAVLQLIVSMGASPPLAAADQLFRGSRHRNIDGCVSFTTKSSCLTGTVGCAWHPHDGCASSMETVQTTDMPHRLEHEGVSNGDYESRLKMSRELQNIKTRKPTRKPIVSGLYASFQLFLCCSSR